MDKIDINKTNNQENQDVMLSFEEVINAASGLSRDGLPATAGRMMISHMVDKNTIKNDMEGTFGNSVIDFFASGGCMVVQVDFPKTGTRDFEQIADICSEYMKHAGDEAWLENRDLITVMVPLAFYGDITIVLRDLVYFTAINLDDNGTRLIMCFNNMLTQLMENEDIDYDEIALQVRGEALREEEQLKEELSVAEDEVKELERQENSYINPIGLSYENILNKELEHTKQEPTNSGFRFTDDEE